jgi:hypothetical protein
VTRPARRCWRGRSSRRSPTPATRANDGIVDDPGVRDLESAEVVERFRVKDWRTLTARFLRDNADAPFFLSPASFAHYLPAFMRVSVLQLDRWTWCR